MLKENHIIAAGSIGCAIKSAMQKYPNLPLIVEVENLTQLQQVLPLDGVERVLCDNFSIVDLAQAVRLSNGKLPLEASGNIDENTPPHLTAYFCASLSPGMVFLVSNNCALVWAILSTK
jgi:nicotinate-nucleotide pyrophosphorylase (carboxylating)